MTDNFNIYLCKRVLLVLLAGIWGIISTSIVLGADNVNNFYIIPDSNSRYLSESDISDMPPQILNYAKNEIYARHGRLFKSVELQNYFQSQTWYHGTVPGDSFKESLYFNDYEDKNSKFISAREKSLTDGNGYSLDSANYSFQPVLDYLKAQNASIEDEQVLQENVVESGAGSDNQENVPVITEIPSPFQDFVSKFSIMKTGPQIPVKFTAGRPWCEKEGVLGAYVGDFNQDKEDECLMLYVAREDTSRTEYVPHTLHAAVLSKKSGEVKAVSDILAGNIDKGAASCDERVYLKKLHDQLYIVVQFETYFNGVTNDIKVFHIDEKNKIVEDSHISGGNAGGIIYVPGKHSSTSDDAYQNEIDWTLSGIGKAYQEEMAPFDIQISLQTNAVGLDDWMIKTETNTVELCGIQFHERNQSDIRSYTFFNRFPEGVIQTMKGQ